MTEQTEIVDVETSRVSCNGGGGALGHPKNLP
jgi:Zinc-finger domain.